MSILPRVAVPRFFAPQAAARDTTIELPDDEASHLTRVLRLRPGDSVRIFNGRGDEWSAIIDETSRQRVTVTLQDPAAATAEPRIAITLAAAVLKGEKMDGVVRDAVMLGAAAIQPIITSRTEIARATIEKSRRIARWQRIAVASAKQCGRAVVPAVRAVIALDEALRIGELSLMLAEPTAAAPSRRLREVRPADRATVFVGPEGGWTGDELKGATASGTILLTLGAHTLRADAVPTVALTALRVHWDDF